MHILLSFAFNLCGFLPLENGSSSFSKKVIPAVPCFAVRDTFSLSWHCPYIFYSASHAANVMLCRGSNSNSSPRHHHCTGWRKTLLISRIINVVIYCNGWFVPQPERETWKRKYAAQTSRGGDGGSRQKKSVVWSPCSSISSFHREKRENACKCYHIIHMPHFFLSVVCLGKSFPRKFLALTSSRRSPLTNYTCRDKKPSFSSLTSYNIIFPCSSTQPKKGVLFYLILRSIQMW